jgi:hypothetical protein
MPAIDLAFAGEGFEALCQGFGAKRSVCDGKGDRDFSGQICMWDAAQMSLIVGRNQKRSNLPLHGFRAPRAVG